MADNPRRARPQGRPLPTVFGCDLELLFVTSVLRLQSLHYGYWDARTDSITTLDAIRKAQARFTEELMKFVPRHARTVLDVGAGIGDNARWLASRGLKVTAISPDRNHGRFYTALDRQRITYIRTRFEELEVETCFDLILICESLNYFDREVGLQQCRRYLTRGGHLLVAAMFQDPDGKPLPETFDPHDLPYIELAGRRGFRLDASRDITEHVLPTLEYAHRPLRRYVFPILHVFSPGSLVGTWVRKTPGGGIADAIDGVKRFYERRTNAEYFRRHIRYVFLFFSRIS